MLIIQDADGLTKYITKAALLTIATHTPLLNVSGSNITEDNLELSVNLLESLLEIATMEVRGVSHMTIPIRYYTRKNVRKIQCEGQPHYVTELTFELPFSTENHIAIQNMCKFIAQHKWIQHSNVVGLDVSLYTRYYYKLDEKYNLEQIYEDMVSNEQLKATIVEAAYVLKENTFILSLIDMAECDTVMRHYLHRHS